MTSFLKTIRIWNKKIGQIFFPIIFLKLIFWYVI